MTSLHVYAAPHQNFPSLLFEDLNNCAKQNIQQTLEILTGASNLAALHLIPKTSPVITKALSKAVTFIVRNEIGVKHDLQNTDSRIKYEDYWYEFGSIAGRRTLCYPMSHLYIASEEEDASNQEAMVILSAARARFASILQSGNVPSGVQRQKSVRITRLCFETHTDD